MARRTTSGRRGGPETGSARSASGGDSAEDRFLVLAEQLGRIVGTMQAKAGSWLDRDALMQQLSQVRDAATHLLEQIGVAAGTAQTGTAQTKTTQTATARKTAPGSGRQGTARSAGRQGNQQAARGRSGGVVDAPGKTHRKPVPNETIASAAETGRIAKMKTINAKRRRGR